MIVTLAGAPGTGKKDFARELAERLDYNLIKFTPPTGELAIGELADYRVELSLALSRTITLWQNRSIGANIVQTHSLLDSLVYVTLRYALYQSYPADPVDTDRWMLTYLTTTQVADDTFTTDFLYFLPGNDGTDYGRSVERAFGTLWEKLGAPTVPDSVESVVNEVQGAQR